LNKFKVNKERRKTVVIELKVIKL